MLLVELCGFFSQALQHAKMLTLHIVSQNNPNHYHLRALKPCTLSAYKTNHTYPTLGRQALWGRGMRGKERLVTKRESLERTVMAAFGAGEKGCGHQRNGMKGKWIDGWQTV